MGLYYQDFLIGLVYIWHNGQYRFKVFLFLFFFIATLTWEVDLEVKVRDLVFL